MPGQGVEAFTNISNCTSPVGLEVLRMLNLLSECSPHLDCGLMWHVSHEAWWDMSMQPLKDLFCSNGTVGSVNHT